VFERVFELGFHHTEILNLIKAIPQFLKFIILKLWQAAGQL
jgi:hypothetical protein